MLASAQLYKLFAIAAVYMFEAIMKINLFFNLIPESVFSYMAKQLIIM